MYARSHPDQDAACLDGRSWCGAHFQNMDLLHFLNIAIVFFQGHMQEEFHKTFTRVQFKNRWTWVFLEIFFQGHIREDFCKLQDFHRRSCSWNETSMSYPSLSRDREWEGSSRSSFACLMWSGVTRGAARQTILCHVAASLVKCVGSWKRCEWSLSQALSCKLSVEATNIFTCLENHINILRRLNRYHQQSSGV